MNASSRHDIPGVAFFSWTTELPIAPSSRIHQHAFTQPLGPNYIYHWHDMLLVRYSGARCHRPWHCNKYKEIYGWIRSLTCQNTALTLSHYEIPPTWLPVWIYTVALKLVIEISLNRIVSTDNAYECVALCHIKGHKAQMWRLWLSRIWNNSFTNVQLDENITSKK